MDRRFSTLMVLAIAALFAEACSSSNNGGGTGGSSSTGGATGTGGVATGGKTGAGGMTSTGGVTGAGGRTDGGADVSTSVGGMTGGADASDAPKDMSVAETGGNTDTGGADADPAMSEKGMCLTPMFMANVTTQPFTADQFCTLYFSLCNGRVGATNFADQAACRAAYNGYNMTPDADMSPSGQQGCRSYHLCNAYGANGNTTAATLNTHCPHSTGFLPNDAGPGGPCP